MTETSTCPRCWAEVRPSNLLSHSTWHDSLKMIPTHFHPPDIAISALDKKVEALGHRVHLVEKRTGFKGQVF